MIIPNKLKPGDEIRVVAPSRSLSLLSEENIKLAKEKLESLGFKVTFSQHCSESDIFISSSIKSRVEDLHTAFSDDNVKAILTVIGGFNCNQLLSYLDYELIKNNPKIICGYSDTTAITNAITAKTGLVTYSGPPFSLFAMKKEFEYNLEYFKKCLMQNDEIIVKASETWSDDAWYLDQEKRNLIKNEGYVVLNQGVAEGTIVGGNLCTFQLLHGTEFMPNLKDTILFVEDCVGGEDEFVVNFDRDLQSIIHQPGFDKVKGIVIGNFQANSGMDLEKLKLIIKTKKELDDLPILANVNFGHVNPIFTFPIGGIAKLTLTDEKVELKIIQH